MCLGFDARGGAGAKALNARFGLLFVPEQRVNCGHALAERRRISNTTFIFAGTELSYGCVVLTIVFSKANSL